MEKEFVSYELAIRLKELGFDEPCFGYYGVNNIESKLFFDIDPDDGELTSLNQNQFYHNNLSEVGRISAPLKQQTFRWFREKYELNSEIYLQNELDKGYYHYLVTQLVRASILYKSQNTKKFESHEEAESSCIDNLIEIVEQKNEI